jgi:hypothetical protein
MGSCVHSFQLISTHEPDEPQIIYNPCTGGCYDGLEATHVNLNQGAESTVSYLMARLTIGKYRNE